MALVWRCEKKNKGDNPKNSVANLRTIAGDMDRFDEMRAFVRVVEAGGISAAAEQLGMAKSAVSRRLAELENRLDVQLLQRTTRRMHLTDAGQEFYQRCVAILDELESAEQGLMKSRHTLEGRLRINAPLTLGLRHLMPLLEGFMAEHPALQLDVDLDDHRVDLIEEGVDVVLRVGQLEDSSLIARPLCPVPLLFCASPGYLERHGTPRTPADLNGHEVISYSLASEARQWVIGGERLRPRVRMRANNGDLMLQAAEAGLGIARLPTFIIHRSLAEGRLCSVLDGYAPEPEQLFALYASRRHLPRRVRAFLDFLAQRLEGGGPWERA